MNVAVDPERPVARFDVGEHRLVLREGEWSNWIPVRFSLISPIASVSGIIRVYVQQLHPHVAVYVSPINIEPASPAIPISEPESYSRSLAKDVGPFYTQGMPYDTAAFRSGALTRDEYMEQSRHVSRQTIELFEYALDRFENGLLFFHFFGIDQDSHMLWGKYDAELLRTYKVVDDFVGRVRARKPDATLVVMSDHGFANFDRSVNLNTWLMKEGFLALDDPANTGNEELLTHVDWSRTQAYALGLNAIYVNQQFREREGIVGEGGEKESILADIEKRLLQLRDPASGKLIVHSVARTGSEMQAEVLSRAPDLIVGYYPGYRSSWQTALGAVPANVVEENTDEWRGDHCISAQLVPGVLLSNRTSQVASPRLLDLTVTILDEFGIDRSGQLEGKDIYSAVQ
jgi:predicted AlkP superfamily phosphohydrolase/phosphomutase